MTDLSGKTAIVTGASRGIGASTAAVLAQAGANVVLAARSSGAIKDVAEQITDAGGSAIPVECDVASAQSVAAMVAKSVDTFGGVDILVGNAGVIEPISMFSKSVPEDWGRAIDINLKGVYYGMRAVLPHMHKRGGGTIITIGSGAAHSPLEGWSHYCSSKAGVLMLCQCLHREEGLHGITSINLSPGTVATEMQVEIKASGINPVSQLDPSVHIPPEWPARAILWLSGPDGAEFAGQEVSLRDEGIRKRIGLI